MQRLRQGGCRRLLAHFHDPLQILRIGSKPPDFVTHTTNDCLGDANHVVRPSRVVVRIEPCRNSPSGAKIGKFLRAAPPPRIDSLR